MRSIVERGEGLWSVCLIILMVDCLVKSFLQRFDNFCQLADSICQILLDLIIRLD